MKHSISYHIWPRHTRFDDVLLWCREFAAEREIVKLSFANFQLKVDQFETIVVQELDQFKKVLQTHRHFGVLSTTDHLTSESESKSLWFSFHVQSGIINVEIDSRDVDLVSAAHAPLREQFQFRNPAAAPLNEVRHKGLHATVFLGHHFDAPGLETARTVEKFLRLLRFDVIEGEPYASQPIPEKVKLGIERQDIYIGLVTGRREHDWIIAESAFANGKDKHVILMVEEGCGFNPTMSGKDLEQIRFAAGHPEKSFCPLLEEFRSVGIAGLF